jgi:hypothetical protein
MKEEQLKKLLTSYVSNAVILLENAEDLKETPMYEHDVKLWGNKFLEALERKVVKVEKGLYKSEEDIKLSQGIQKIYEDVFQKMANLSIYQVSQLSSFIDALSEGKVTEVSDEDLKKLKDGKG